MKRTEYYLSAAAVCLVLTLTLVVSSCRKVEREPKDWFGSELVFDTMDQNGVVAGFNLNDLYNYMPTGFNRISSDFLDAGTDDAIPSRLNTPVQRFTDGRINALNNPDPYWSNSYFGIRRATIFIKNIDKVPLEKLSAANALTKRYYRAEARFIRALLYFELVKRYGGVPLLGDTTFTLEDNLDIPRNNFDTCINYIVSECSAVKDSLILETAMTDGYWGHVPRGAAVALKTRALLYAASPLYNGGGIETDPVKKALTGYLTYDPARWQRVLAAAEEFMGLGYYSLISSATPATAFSSVFTVKRNLEIILARQSGNSSNLEVSQSPIGFVSNGTISQGLTSPTQNFVDAFPMRNGLAITDPASGYSAANPYTNRDARLDATVFYNGLRWLGGRAVQTHEGGLDRPNTTTVQTRTGYYLRKFLADFSTGTAYSNQSHNFPIFRYAEMILNLAEALNEVGRMEDAVTQLIRIRARAGITAGTNNRYGIKAGITQAELRAAIQNERRIELAFEEHRFWDVRRWKIAEQVLNTTLNGMRITGTGTTATYQVVPVGTAVFQPKLYHMPLPYDETTKNTALIQNEGW
ncbi:RagB/SusD family nutrient uptake outer membrane protein [Segetibacter sp. 3557_3]|uniref:RagB/SusD family nutrient uptake outer membrane protein n=1 Tax=Segetibacter sp. 3557_3 TaxID=2547429 RepID=UPI001058C141|nr:RagB/SusD family nutrient uptake outer membrane protein [Segetibacter sp. 3557_3]TDH24523.1 RagB/SusD family nutrient uptake outer membrane protein [Segetibacter sp. 3557_3]